jgi:extracellular matrix protein 14
VTPEHIDIYFPPNATNNNNDDQLSIPPLSAHAHSTTLIPIPRPSYSRNANDEPNPNTNWTSQPPSTSSYHAAYHPLFEIEAFLRELAREYPGLVTLVKVGMSGEGREVWGVRVSSSEREDGKEGKRKGEGEGKMGFVITGAQHAREVSPIIPHQLDSYEPIRLHIHTVDSDSDNPIYHPCPRHQYIRRLLK